MPQKTKPKPYTPHRVAAGLREKRMELGKSLDEVGEAMGGVPRSTLHHYEDGRSGLPVDLLPAWGRALEVYSDVILADIGAPWPEQLNHGQRKLLDQTLASIPLLDSDQAEALAATVAFYTKANAKREASGK